MSKKLIAVVDVFKGLKGAQLDAVAKCAEVMTIRGEKIIFKEGQKGDRMYLIAQGIVEIWKKDASNPKGSRLARLKAGNIFGEMSLFDGEPRSATATTAIARRTKLLVWNQKDIAGLIRAHPAIGQILLINIITKLSHRLRISNDSIQTLLTSQQYINL
jgi:CRP-like cAMP-binding protein